MCVFGTDGVVARLSLIYSAVIPVGCAAFGIYLGVPQVRENAKSRRSPLVSRFFTTDLVCPATVGRWEQCFLCDVDLNFGVVW